MSNNNTQPISFWQLLDKFEIEIPIIQRDYAQGRIGKEKLREKFLKDLKDALDGKLSNDEKVLKLDFIYGSIKNKRLNPLDGQQRLTTLWLLHWFIAQRAEKLSDNKEMFNKFTYETRVSSREFCNNMSKFELNSEAKIVSVIEDQPWFFSVWKQDPTIQAMLTMLGGTVIKDVKNNDIIDGIEELFDKNCDFEKYWNLLIGENCPIKFHYLPLDELRLSDDLYIKMNARGKALTPFENFKADLVGFLKNKTENDDYYIGFDTADFDHNLDTNWTDIFWKFRSEDHKIDEIYFAFINRFFLNELIRAKNIDKKDLYTQDQIEATNTYKILYDNNITYSDFSVYSPKYKDNNKEQEVFGVNIFKRLSKILNNFHVAFNQKDKSEINRLFFPNWDSGSSFKFIPEYKDKEGSITTLNQGQRVVFYAICRYFETGDYNEKSFRQWKRVVWNIVENAGINSIPSMIGAMRLIDELVEGAADIYKFLKEKKTDIKSDFAEEQMKEEIQKAIQIKNDSSGEWERKIIEAEQHAFFKGAIRFLFRTDVDTYDWSKFVSRFEKANEYFDENGVKEKYKNDAILLRSIISLFSEWENFQQIYYNSNMSNWRDYILKNDNAKFVLVLNSFFEIDDIANHIVKYTSKITDQNLLLCQIDLCKTLLLTKEELLPSTLNNNMDIYWDRMYYLHTNGCRNYTVIGHKRNILLSTLFEKNSIESYNKIEGVPYFWGWDIQFRVNDNNLFMLDRWDNLKKWNTKKEQYQDVKDSSGNSITIDNLEVYLTKPT